MGYGAYLSIRNETANTIRTLIASQDCMYDHGKEGSNLCFFDAKVVDAFSSSPKSGGLYIESKGSGVCTVSPSRFKLKIYGIGEDPFTLDFIESANYYWLDKEVKDVNVTIDNDIKQATIVVVIQNVAN